MEEERLISKLKFKKGEIMTYIIGAGIAGLMAANIFQRAHVFEAGKEGQVQHKAVLRFRSSAVGDAVGIDFRKVIVHKGLWCDGRAVQPSIMYANLYSRKVIGRLADRSIWKLEPAERFIAPEDFVAQLAERCANRIDWEHPIESFNRQDDCISTMPMNVTARMLPSICAGEPSPSFEYAQIVVKRWHVPNADVFQTVYFPDPNTSLYRASITGDLLIAEYAGAADDYDLFSAFGLLKAECRAHDTTKQRYGKIAPIDERWRRNFILQATLQHRIYSVGRFATWKNELLDGVLHDIYVVKKLMSSSNYEKVLKS